MAFKEMDPKLILSLISNETDIITPAVQTEKLLYEKAICPKCGNEGAVKITRAPKFSEAQELLTSPFNPDKILSSGYAQCQSCGTEFLPTSNIILSEENLLSD